MAKLEAMMIPQKVCRRIHLVQFNDISLLTLVIDR